MRYDQVLEAADKYREATSEEEAKRLRADLENAIASYAAAWAAVCLEQGTLEPF